MFISRSRRRPAGPSQAPALSNVRSVRFALTAAIAALCGFAAATSSAQDTFKPPPPVTYTEKYELYGGINFMNGQAGQNLPKRYNMAGGEVMGTYWLTPKWGAAANIRWDGGTTPVLPAAQSTTPKIQTRPFVSQTIYMGGVQYHYGGNQSVGLNFHALAGASSGNFDHSNPGVSSQTFFNTTGLYTNRTAFNAVAGGSLDFNRSAHVAIRLSPEIVFEKFGTELREYFYVSAGVIYRFGNR